VSRKTKSKRKFCIVGPSYPFRGGIPHYTTLLYKHLKKKYDVSFYAFKRQYPKCLFPGKTDKDPSNIAIKDDSVENILDSMNPFTWWQTFQKIKKDNPNLLILPWWVFFWTPQFWTIVTFAKIFTSAKILFICHNIVEHESHFIKKLCTKIVLKKGDYFIVHSEEDLKNLKRMLPNALVQKAFLPTLEEFNFEPVDKNTAKKKLGIEGKVLLFFGFVRPYKGLKYLLDALPLILKEIDDVTLMVVGEFWWDKEEYLNQIDALKIKDKVRIVDEYVPNEEVGKYFSAADVVVLPYTSATQSAIIQLAYGFNKPVIVTNVGGLPDAVDDGKTGFLVETENPQAIAHAVISFYKGEFEKSFVSNVIKAKEKFSWDRMVESIAGLANLGTVS